MSIDDCGPLEPGNIVKYGSYATTTTDAIALASACRSLRKELLPYFYQTNIDMKFLVDKDEELNLSARVIPSAGYGAWCLRTECMSGALS